MKQNLPAYFGLQVPQSAGNTKFDCRSYLMTTDNMYKTITKIRLESKMVQHELKVESQIVQLNYVDAII